MNYRLVALSGTMLAMTLVAAITAGGSMTTPLAAQAASSPTFNKDIAPIIFDNCVRCHRPSQVAPMSLMSYKEIRPWARAIKTKVLKGEMPPWYADPRYGEFSNDPRLSAAQIRLLSDGVDAGAPEGDTPLVAALPKLNAGWTHPSGREPDIVNDAPPFNAPAQGEVPWFNVYSEIPDSFKGKEIFVEALQILPGEIAGMHHAGFRLRPKPEGTRIGEGEAWPGGLVISNTLLDAKTGKPLVLGGADDEGVGGGGAFRSESDDPNLAAFDFCCYVPGGTFAQFGDGGYLRIPAYKDGMIFWSMHYTMTGRPVTDKTRVGLWIQKNPKFEIDTGSGPGLRVNLVQGKELAAEGSGSPDLPRIPPNMADYSITAIQAYTEDVTLYTTRRRRPPRRQIA